MKTLVFRACLFLSLAFLAAVATARASDTNPPSRLTVELRDGSRVVGTSVEKNFKFHSALFGQIKLNVKDIRSVECLSTNSAKLTAVNGDKYYVEFSLTELSINTSFGIIKIPVSQIRQLHVWAGGTGLNPLPMMDVLAGPITNPANSHSYYLLKSNSWTGAEAIAVALGGHLATVRDANEQNWIYETFSTYGGINCNLWIGLYNPTRDSNGGPHEANFVWVNGEPATYTHWSPGEPNNYNNRQFYCMMFGPPDARASYWDDDDNIGSLNTSGIVIAPAYGVVEVTPDDHISP